MLEIKNIKKKYGRETILSEIDLTIQNGTSVAIVGKNGSGKTTLLRILAGVMKPDDGMLTYNGKKLFTCGYVPQVNPLLEELTVYDNMRLWGKRKDIAIAAEKYMLDDLMKKKVSSLSGGMKRRVSIACALMNQPEILIMDEPSAALDLYHKQCITDLILNYKKEGNIILIATHDLEEIMICDQIVFLENGCLNILEKTENLKNEIIQRINMQERL